MDVAEKKSSKRVIKIELELVLDKNLQFHVLNVTNITLVSHLVLANGQLSSFNELNAVNIQNKSTYGHKKKLNYSAAVVKILPHD